MTGARFSGPAEVTITTEGGEYRVPFDPATGRIPHPLAKGPGCARRGVS